ncbi:MAG TPA: BrnT family toxin [Rhodoblastus sp.]|nr:BrnT family toxin [Rhodoblastus sp.]
MKLAVTLEWDERKREKTLAERGLDFADVAAADWDIAFTVEDVRTDYNEVRFVTMAPIGNRLCVFAWCRRGDALRVISLRRANERERSRYEEALHRP